MKHAASRVIAMLLSLVASSAAAAQPASRQGFCATDDVRTQRPSRPTLRPRDEAPSQPDFLAFRRALQAAIDRRDAGAVVRIAEPDVKLDFGGGDGIDFLRSSMADPDRDFWGELRGTLALGGVFEGDGAFTAPYVSAAWPADFDAFACAAITGSGVRLRERPSLTARTLARLDFDIVERADGPRETPGWIRVRLASGLAGYVSSTFYRSPVGYRASFVPKDGGWRLRWFLAGD